MPYRQLKVDPKAPARVKALVERVENHYLRDVHCMLRLPLSHYGLTAGCNFAIAQVLMATIGGVSVTLYSQSGRSGRSFKNLLVDYYPWDLEPKTTLKPANGAEIIYSVFRNPLTHDLGLGLEKKATTPKVLIKRLVTENKTRGLPEATIERIEDTENRFRMSATLTAQPDATVLLVEALYWGVRVMLERLTRDASRIQKADTFLA